MTLPALTLGTESYDALTRPWVAVLVGGEAVEFGTWAELTVYYRGHTGELREIVRAARLFFFDGTAWREVAWPSFGN